MNKQYHKTDRNNESKTTNRIAVISSLIALSIAILAIFHGDNKILGLEIKRGSFIEILVNFLKLTLWFSIASGTTFLTTTGYFNGFNYDENYKTEAKVIQKLVSKWHSLIFWLHKKSYGLTIEIFILSFISIAFNMVAKMLGFYGVGSLIVATAITAIIIIVAFAILLYKRFMNRKLTKK